MSSRELMIERYYGNTRFRV